MTKEAGRPAAVAETSWMSHVKDYYGPISQALKDVPEDLKQYKSVVFERLFEAALENARESRHAGPRVGPGEAPRTAGVESFQRFIADYKISMETLANIVDVESALVLARNLGSTRSESQRKLAALLALANAYKTGEFSVSREQLVESCKLHAIYDSANFAANMSYDFKGSVVFIREASGGYKVSRPGEAYIADVVQTLLSTVSGGTTA